MDELIQKLKSRGWKEAGHQGQRNAYLYRWNWLIIIDRYSGEFEIITLGRV